MIVKENSSNASGHASMCDLEVSVAPGLELGVVGGVVLVASDLLGQVEVLAVGFVEVIPVETHQVTLTQGQGRGNNIKSTIDNGFNQKTFSYSQSFWAVDRATLKANIRKPTSYEASAAIYNTKNYFLNLSLEVLKRFNRGPVISQL